MGVLDSFGLLLAAFGDPVQEFKNLVCCDGFNASLSKVLAESGEERLIRLDRIFFVN